MPGKMNGILTVGLTIFTFLHLGGAFECTNNKYSFSGTFHCPLPGEDEEDMFCCGPAGQQYCCDSEDYAAGFGIGIIVAIIIGALILFASLILLCCCCCSGCYLYKRRQKRGVVLSTAQPKPPTQVNIYPNQGYTAVPSGYATAPPGQITQAPYGSGYTSAPPVMPPPPGMYPYGGPQPPPYPNQPLPPEYSKPPPFAE